LERKLVKWTIFNFKADIEMEKLQYIPPNVQGEYLILKAAEKSHFAGITWRDKKIKELELKLRQQAGDLRLVSTAGVVKALDEKNHHLKQICSSAVAKACEKEAEKFKQQLDEKDKFIAHQLANYTELMNCYLDLQKKYKNACSPPKCTLVSVMQLNSDED
jgi:hypothetical protein